MVHFTALLSIAVLLGLSSASLSEDAAKNQLGLTRVSPNPKVEPRSLFHKRCEGTCEECFGTGYTLCPGSSYYCYLPGDTYYGLDSCTSTSSGSDTTYTSSAPEPTSTGTAGDSNFCTGAGATCVSCFGEGYLDCPDNYNCYNPNDPQYDTCPSDTSSGSGGSSSSCADQYGSGSLPCGSDSCYNPTEGDVCCADGYHCEDGYTCSSIVGKCCAPGSTNSGCSGSGSGGLLSSSSYTYSYTTSSYSFPSYTFATSTSGEDSFATATSTSATSTDTGVTQFASSSGARSGVETAAVKVASLVLAMFGAGMLML